MRLFYGLTEQPGLLPPTREADNLVREGQRAISSGDERALESVNQRLIRMIPRDEQSKVIGLIKP
jgi:molecular chaperone DnaK